MMKVILTGGGTGGHIYPALALARYLKKKHPDIEILYIGSARGLEADIVKKEGIPFRAIEIAGFKRKLSFSNIKTVYLFLKAVWQIKRWIRSFQPDAVIGTGGYVAGPVVYAATRLKVPALIHEQNVIPGLTNSFLARFVDRVCVSFSGSAQYFPREKVVMTGNPRATEVVEADGNKGRASLNIPDDKRIVLIVGGSRGAEAINEAFLSILAKLDQLKNHHFIYVTGEKHYDSVMSQWQEMDKPVNVTIRPFLYNMPEVLAATDLIVNRAGASFLAEMTALGIPSILIPSPYVTNNHQEKNACWMEEQGASVMILERDLTGPLLFEQIKRILQDDDLWNRMKTASLKLGQPESASLFYQEIRNLLERRKK